MDHDMGRGLWDDERPAMGQSGGGSRSSQQVNENCFAMGSGIARDAINVPYDTKSLEADIDTIPASGQLSGSMPMNPPVFGHASMSNLTGTSVEELSAYRRCHFPLTRGLGRRESDYLNTSQGPVDISPFPNQQNRGARSVDTTSPTTSHNGMAINSDYGSFDTGGSLSSSPNFSMDNQSQNPYLNLQQASFTQGGFATGQNGSRVPYAMSNHSSNPSRAVSRSRGNQTIQTQGLDELLLHHQPLIELCPAVGDDSTLQSQWSTPQELTGNFGWHSSPDGMSVGSSPHMMDIPDFSFRSEMPPLPDFGPGVISPARNMFAPSDLGGAQSDIRSDYAASEATSIVTTETHTAQSDSHYLTVPMTSRRLSDPTPMKFEDKPVELSRTLSASSPRRILRPQGPKMRRKSVGAPRAASVNAASPVRPDMSNVELPAPPPRGRRVGPMPEDKKKAVRHKRFKKSTCTRCKFSKVSCDQVPNSDACQKCHKFNSNSSKPAVCSRAHFLDLVTDGTTNYIAQYSINHFQRDLTHRRCLAVPEYINFPELMPLINTLRREHDLRVSQEAVPLYDVNLDATNDYFEMHSRSLPSQYPFREFINMKSQRDDDWKLCIREPDPLDDLLGSLIVWNNMPSRVTYSLVTKANGFARILDPDSPDDKPIIYAAAQISRLISRKLELAAYAQLQHDLNNATGSLHILPRLARLLLSLRWRISWWVVVGGGIGVVDQRDLHQFTIRVRKLCSILYFYYCWMRKSVSYGDGAPGEKTSQYADTQCAVTEVFPEEESLGGFQRWMEDGKAKIHEAGAAEQLRTVGLAWA